MLLGQANNTDTKDSEINSAGHSGPTAGKDGSSITLDMRLSLSQARDKMGVLERNERLYVMVDAAAFSTDHDCARGALTVLSFTSLLIE